MEGRRAHFPHGHLRRARTARGEVVRVGLTKTHVLFRIDGWTIALPTDSAARFPKVDDVIPKTDPAATRWHVSDDESAALATLLDKLPAAKEDLAPVTLDLSRPVAIRARGEGEKRCTEVMLPRSRLEGKALRMIVTNRHFLKRALELGFRSVRSWRLTSRSCVGKPTASTSGCRSIRATPWRRKSMQFASCFPAWLTKPSRRRRSRRTMAQRPRPTAGPTSHLPSTAACLRWPRGLLRSLWSLVAGPHTKTRSSKRRFPWKGPAQYLARGPSFSPRLEDQRCTAFSVRSPWPTWPAKGTVTNSSVVGRGLFKAIRHMVDGQYREAGIETLAAVAARPDELRLNRFPGR